MVHDHGHPGLTADFLIATSDPLAVRYNDRSPLENHHGASFFSMLMQSDMNVLAQLTQHEKNAFRKQVRPPHVGMPHRRLWPHSGMMWQLALVMACSRILRSCSVWLSNLCWPIRRC